jgi:hypothetical protein
MNAQQARELTAAGQQTKEDAINYQIEVAAQEGRNYTWTDFVPSETLVSKLKENGFTVTVMSEKDARISW